MLSFFMFACLRFLSSYSFPFLYQNHAVVLPFLLLLFGSALADPTRESFFGDYPGMILPFPSAEEEEMNKEEQGYK